MPAALNPTRRSFAPTPLFTLLALAAAALCVRLGLWQWHRGVERQAAWTRFEAGTARLVDAGQSDLGQLPLFQRVAVRGAYDTAHQFLLDNRSWQGHPGYEVVTPLMRAGAPSVLVDRGWVPFTGSRRQLPDVSLATPGTLSVTGRLADLPAAGLALGRAPPAGNAAWPKVTSFPDLGQLQLALGVPLAPRIVLLDPSAPFGYVRDWQAPGLSPLRHFGYAIQWWCFAVLALVLWVLGSRRRRTGDLT
jgi:surfeit locus 1 family protein